MMASKSLIASTDHLYNKNKSIVKKLYSKSSDDNTSETEDGEAAMKQRLLTIKSNNEKKEEGGSEEKENAPIARAYSTQKTRRGKCNQMTMSMLIKRSMAWKITHKAANCSSTFYAVNPIKEDL
ncbi:hypothetical protein TRFO_34095 [Tritrichomonas foetus]|uniref:Uncharacterized protein n=1 Tax=Tritrichomonas foetus TaxID=1144522 RepID=A0A1J4JJT4_9EUKA|nr:hypothetical protein TRFO_34095 [Tritrichomonas foetus]|eukprot:OHS99422.1 hypothetical protein TRFO_34095 [Tritrichomonas foetus]